MVKHVAMDATANDLIWRIEWLHALERWDILARCGPATEKWWCSAAIDF